MPKIKRETKTARSQRVAHILEALDVFYNAGIQFDGIIGWNPRRIPIL